MAEKKITVYLANEKGPLTLYGERLWFVNEESYGSVKSVAPEIDKGGILVNPSNIAIVDIESK